MEAHDPTPLEVVDYLNDAYKKYYDSAFWLKNESLMAERNALLNRPGVTCQDLYLECVPAYPNRHSLIDVSLELGLSLDVAKAISFMLSGKDNGFLLREHQAQSLRTSLTAGGLGERNVVVTSGTGSGKTESFLLPIFARLLRERANLEHTPDFFWWDQSFSAGGNWQGLRSRQSDDAFALRSMILYPTNALVEDQLSRIRIAAIGA